MLQMKNDIIYPTVTIFPFCAAKFVYKNDGFVDEMIKQDKNCREGAKFDGMDGIVGADILKLLRKKPSVWQEPLLATRNCLIFKTKNIIQMVIGNFLPNLFIKPKKYLHMCMYKKMHGFIPNRNSILNFFVSTLLPFVFERPI